MNSLKEYQMDGIQKIFITWMKVSLIPTAAVFVFFTWPHEGLNMPGGYPLGAFVAAGGAFTVFNMPNLLLTLMNLLVCWAWNVGK